MAKQPIVSTVSRAGPLNGEDHRSGNDFVGLQANTTYTVRTINNDSDLSFSLKVDKAFKDPTVETGLRDGSTFSYTDSKYYKFYIADPKNQTSGYNFVVYFE